MAEFKASVGLSRKWDAREAGREVAFNTLEKLGDKKPDFFLLFSTIHYEKHGGFQAFLDGVWEVLPEGTPLIGGTVMGFVNNAGCYTRGATALAVNYPQMDVSVGLGRNTKRGPRGAVRQCTKMIKKGLEGSKYKNRFLFDLISGIKIPKIPGIKRRSIIESEFAGRLAPKMFGLSGFFLQKGFGQEEVMLADISKELKDFYILHGSSLDQELTTNYQFFGDKVLTNSIVSLGLCSDLEFNLSFSCRANLSEKFRITEISNDRMIIHKIDDLPATDRFLELIGWRGEIPTEKQFLFGITTYFPICFVSSGKLVLRPVVSMIGKSLVLMSRFDADEGYVGRISERDIIGSLDDVLKEGLTPQCGILSSCAVRLMGAGAGIFAERDTLISYFKDKPFIMLHFSGEATYNPNEKVYYLNEAVASSLISC